MSSGLSGLADAGKSFPRVSGDEPLPQGWTTLVDPFSPRERG